MTNIKENMLSWKGSSSLGYTHLLLAYSQIKSHNRNVSKGHAQTSPLAMILKGCTKISENFQQRFVRKYNIYESLTPWINFIWE